MAIKSIKRICVVGSGVMGHQIALKCAVHGFLVKFVDSSKQRLLQAGINIQKELDRRIGDGRLCTKEKEEILERIQSTEKLSEGVMESDLVIESINEDLEAKRNLFAQLDEDASSS
ncbi:MAG: hypothetical protein HQM08_09580 [Candidatus Riflebacteria bacterium]|nr:hypothetical protein [Candidatus Riflebacteria bacterium]